MLVERNNIYRKWINQPSTHQPLHHWHAINVLAVVDPNDPNRSEIWFLSGNVISARVPTICLSDGWIHKKLD